MVWEKLRALARPTPAAGGQYRVVAHRPVLRAFLLVLLGVVVGGGVAFGYWLGGRHSDLDRIQLEAMKTRERALDVRMDALNRQLADARLAQSVDAEAARSLRGTISELRERVAALGEEVTFYKSLMAPSSIDRGLQIAELNLSEGETENQFTYHVLLTQAEEQRSWVQGSVQLEVQGVRADDDGTSIEEVLPLTELSDVDPYPMKFRFRYFQDLRGTVTLPEGFRPRTVLVTVTPGGKAAEPTERSFDWIVQAG